MNSVEKEEKRKQRIQLKKEITADLRLSNLRDKLIYYVQQMLIFNMIDNKRDYENALTILNESRLDEIEEERVSLNICSNLACKNQVPKEMVDKLSKRKLVITKSGQIEKNDKFKIFCDKLSRKEESKCEKEYLKLVK